MQTLWPLAGGVLGTVSRNRKSLKLRATSWCECKPINAHAERGIGRKREPMARTLTHVNDWEPPEPGSGPDGKTLDFRRASRLTLKQISCPHTQGSEARHFFRFHPVEQDNLFRNVKLQSQSATSTVGWVPDSGQQKYAVVASQRSGTDSCLRADGRDASLNRTP
jgi:hypothetical protein